MNPWETPPVGPAADLAARVGAKVPQLATARLTLRAPRMTDFDAFARIFRGPGAAYIGGARTRDEAMEVFLAACGSWLLRGHGLWSVERMADSALLGFILLQHETGDPEAELGYLFLPEAEGHGYATEAAGAARDFAREVLGWASFVSYVAPENARSVRVAERLGAVPDAAMLDGCRVYRYGAEGRGQ
jgi:RimJ/RimL family protein N-acetyltransferase